MWRRNKVEINTNQNISGFEVAVGDISVVKVNHSACNLNGNLYRSSWFDFPN